MASGAKAFIYYWLLVSGFACARALVYLPYRWQMKLGRCLGRMSRHIAKRRANIAKANIKLCFPEYSPKQRHELLVKTFASVGMGAMETLIAWFMPQSRFAKIPFHIYGGEYFKQAQASEKGVLLCGGHFTCLEIVGRYFCQKFPTHLVYQKNHHQYYEHIVSGSRKRYTKSLVNREHVRAMVRLLRQGESLWYAPDQDLGPDLSVMAPFFNVPTATLTATAWLTKIGRATLVPAFFYRLANDQGYAIEFKPPLSDYPSGDDLIDAKRYNSLLEQQIRHYPDQYLWLHRRFKTRPKGGAKIYKN